MYAALWRILPGGTVLKAILCAALAALVIVALFGAVFPWIAQITDLADSATMNAAASLLAPA